jgi:hypothetical protein
MRLFKMVALVLVLTFLPLSAFAGGGFPDFITSNKDYYVTRIGKLPDIQESTYRLEITGLVNKRGKWTLEELRALPGVEIPLTVECIGNSRGGPQLSTAVWKGFLLYDFLVSLGIKEGATGVRYEAADGYYASHTLDQVRDNRVMAALNMNGIPIPRLHGFPLRILNPGFYGVKQPAWVTKIEVIDMPMKDYWEDRGWDCSPPMEVDSVIFFPEKNKKFKVGKPVKIGGAAFGGKRIAKVELTADSGQTWTEAKIVNSKDVDNVWVFWEGELTFTKKGSYSINARATDIMGNVQVEKDPARFDGTGDWPLVKVKIR